MRSLLHTSLFLATILDCSAARGAYPPSPVIKGIVWAPTNAIIRLANGSDNWPMTWADDDALYTAYGDGNGFEPQLKEKLSLGLAKVLGTPPQIRGINLRSPSAEAKGDPYNPEVSPVKLEMHMQLPANNWRGPIKISWYQGGAMPDSPNRMIDLNKIDHGAMFEGKHGVIVAVCSK